MIQILSLIAYVRLISVVSSVSMYKEYSENPCGQLYLTQSPNKQNFLELNWNFTCKDLPDAILLTLNDIKINESAQILYKMFPRTVLKGYHKTNISVSNVKFPGNWTEDAQEPDLQATCFDYYIASIRNGTVIHSQCLSIAPAWMSHFGELRIGKILIPGTHNSGAWRGGPPLIKNYILNQNKNFWQQLVYGVRYFDIRVGRYGSLPNDLYINHAFVKCTQLVPELKSVATFLRKSPKEVIILNFHRFPRPKTFTEAYHMEILKVIWDIFENDTFIFSKLMHREGPRLQDFWQRQKRVIISYANDEMIQKVPWLWPSVYREWGNIQELKNLENFIKRIASMPVRGNPLHVVMAELTPNYVYIIKYVTRNLKDLASSVNRDLAHWVREYRFSNNLNIIATDFFTGNDIVNVAIETNFRKLPLLL